MFYFASSHRLRRWTTPAWTRGGRPRTVGVAVVPLAVGGELRAAGEGIGSHSHSIGYPWHGRVRQVEMEGRILDVETNRASEVEMDRARPRAVRPAQRTVAAAPATPGMVREQAFAADDRWVGVVRTEPGVWSGWHHHGDTDTYFYVLRGALELKFGPGGHERLRVRAGDYAHVPHGVIHREGTPPDEPAEVALVRIGSGAPVVNVEGPEPE
jgi:uncharacterized RmlC-like cupin family protein